MSESYDERFRQGVEALTRWYPYLEVNFSWDNAAVLISALQLALSNPQLPIGARGVVAGFVDSALRRIREVSPDFADLIDCRKPAAPGTK